MWNVYASPKVAMLWLAAQETCENKHRGEAYDNEKKEENEKN